MQLPNDVRYIINKLNECGFEAYAVGGCVRDAVLGLVPNDWDITTSAKPEQMQECFKGHRVIETGLKHGTLTVMLHGEGYEITTFRKDGDYTDHRRPDSVEFVSDLRQDLERRDFTINAMATSDGINIIDMFGGKEDLSNGIIRCVGKAEKRFNEDALRILRAVRFASVYDFSIAPETADAALALRETLSNVSPERIFVEIKKLLSGKGVANILLSYPEIIYTVFPELKQTHGFKQNNPWHVYDVWEHTVRSVEAVRNDPAFRLAMLFHDSGKPFKHTVDSKGISHFYGHTDVSESIAKTALKRMKPDTALFNTVCLLVKEHELRFPAERICVKRQLSRLGNERFAQLFDIWRADAMAQNPDKLQESLADIDKKKRIYDDLIAENACVTIAQLAVNGNDLISLGIKGKQTGDIFRCLLRYVIEEELPNEKQALLEKAKSLL